MAEIHESAERLAGALQSLFPAEEIDPTFMATTLNESPQTITNWRSRGVSRDGAISAQRLFGISCTWILDGAEPALLSQSQFARISETTMAEGWELAKMVAAQTAGSPVLVMPRDAHLVSQAVNSVLERQAQRAPSSKLDIGGNENGKRTGETGGSGEPARKEAAGGKDTTKGRGRRKSA